MMEPTEPATELEKANDEEANDEEASDMMTNDDNTNEQAEIGKLKAEKTRTWAATGCTGERDSRQFWPNMSAYRLGKVSLAYFYSS
jgi:hypothetical protein